MIKIENTKVVGFEDAIRGMRNPRNSWEKSDSTTETSNIKIGENDHKLMMKLAKAGSVHGKFRRMIVVYVDITAPLYWWKEFDTYKVGTVANSCSSFYDIRAKEFAIDDFSHEHLIDHDDATWGEIVPMTALETLIYALNTFRKNYLETNDKKYWWQMIQLLPTSYNQKRTVMMNYEVLSNIYQYRRNHKLDEWCELCKWIESLPYSEIITCNAENQGDKEVV